MDVKIEQSWKEVLRDEFEKDYFVKLTEFVREQYASSVTVFPPANCIFAAYDFCPFDQVKVVVIGQDPYFNPGQANGIAFSVQDGTKIPDSLRNIFQEVNTDTGAPIPTSGNLERWARQGVLLTNAILTVNQGAPLSHKGMGWEKLQNRVIDELSSKRRNLVFMLWGAFAQDKEKRIDTSKHLVLKAPHPSPLSAYRGFFGCRHFSKANAYLRQHGLEEIQW
ncbi:MAG: uracil-DNA glycosylase [Paludibacteraceae bacterium]|nr:uracil-DNA glycosylase [Paludibacteraceae bacterium]